MLVNVGTIDGGPSSFFLLGIPKFHTDCSFAGSLEMSGVIEPNSVDDAMTRGGTPGPGINYMAIMDACEFVPSDRSLIPFIAFDPCCQLFQAEVNRRWDFHYKNGLVCLHLTGTYPRFSTAQRESCPISLSSWPLSSQGSPWVRLWHDRRLSVR